MATTTDRSSNDVARELLTPLSQKVPPVRLPWSARVAAWVSAAALTATLLVYALVMIVPTWFLLDYLVGHVRVLFTGGSPGAVIGYIILGTLMLTLLLLLVKPALRVPRFAPEPLEVTRQEQPLLHEYVNRLSDALGAPRPDGIRVTTECTAAAISKRRFGGLLHDKSEILIGLPLAAGLSVRNLTGILAHELGHGLQRHSCRAMAVILQINFWFDRALFEPDRVDDFLVRQASLGILPVRWLAKGALAVIYVGRRLLWLFRSFGHAASCLVSRRGEYESDLYAARIAGSDAVPQMLQQVTVLSVAHQAALGDLGISFQEKRLSDNLPRTVVAKAQRLPKDELQRFVAMLRKQPTRWHDTHPSLLDRILTSQQTKVAGPVRDTRPAAVLFRDFDALCKKSTLEFYHVTLGDQAGDLKLVSAADLIREHAAIEEAEKTLVRYYQGALGSRFPVFPGAEACQPPGETDRSPEALAAAQQAAIAALDPYWDVLAKAIQAEGDCDELHQIGALSKMGFNLEGDPRLGLYQVNAATVSARTAKKQADCDLAVKKLEAAEQPLRRRLTLALQQVRLDPPAAGLEELSTPETRARIDELVATGLALRRARPQILALSKETRVLASLVQGVDPRALRSEVHTHIELLVNRVRKCLLDVHGSLQTVTYPFEHASGRDTTVGDFVVDRSADMTKPPDAAVAAIDALERAEQLIVRVQAALVQIAERVELASGLKQQAQPVFPDPWEMPKGVPTKTDSAIGAAAGRQVALALTILVAIVAGIAGASKTVPKYAVLPKHDQFQTTVVPQTWTPPPRANVWNMGVQPYQPGMHVPGTPQFNDPFNRNQTRPGQGQRDIYPPGYTGPRTPNYNDPRGPYYNNPNDPNNRSRTSPMNPRTPSRPGYTPPGGFNRGPSGPSGPSRPSPGGGGFGPGPR
jgi:Zn-dependent protease with chaperone function